jgi:hypothetical protein
MATGESTGSAAGAPNTTLRPILLMLAVTASSTPLPR